jgi:tetratricopeptide (TPR) repeat protein
VAAAPQQRTDLLTKALKLVAATAGVNTAISLSGQIVEPAAAAAGLSALAGFLSDSGDSIGAGLCAETAASAIARITDDWEQATAFEKLSDTLVAAALIDKALALVPAVGKLGPRSKALHSIAQNLMNIGETVLGLRVAEDSFDAAVEWPSYERKDKLSKILSMIAQGAGAKRALELSGRLPDLGERVACELMAMRALAAGGELDLAKELGRAAVISAATALKPYSDDRSLVDAVGTLYEAGILEEAVSAAKSLSKPFERATALVSIARYLYRAGRPREARSWIEQAAAEAQSGDYEQDVWVRIAETAADIGDPEQIPVPMPTKQAVGLLRRLVSR